MVRQTEISAVIDAQRAAFWGQDSGFEREALGKIPIADSFATIITGIRRSGKSTLLLQLLRRDYGEAIYLNFDDIRLSGFEADDFTRLHKEIVDRGIRVLFFDEIQIVAGWETYINQLLREGYRVFITGSNASMLSAELGSHLTGRHLSMELFPFSYTEFHRFTGGGVEEYLRVGGIPEYVKNQIPAVLQTLVDDILMRDIAVRHAVRDAAALRRLTAYLITNIGNLVSANKLVGMFDIKAASTLLEYFSYLKDAYLMEFVPMFSHSLKVQARNHRKVYMMDLGLYTENAISTSQNVGRRFENLVFLDLRRRHRQLFYYKDRGECDFVVMEKGKITAAIQACHTIDDENFQREYDGLVGAMRTLGLSRGTIVTFDQSDRFEWEGMRIEIIPASEFLTRA